MIPALVLSATLLLLLAALHEPWRH